MDGTRYVRYGDTVGSYLLYLDYHKVNLFFSPFLTFYLGTLAYLIFFILMNDDDDDDVC